MNRFCIYNFGCKVNQEEGAALAALFISQGWQQVEQAPADLLVINTCTVTQVADKKARQLIRRLARECPQAIVAVCGCYAQRAAEEIKELEGVHIVAGVEQRKDLPTLVAQYRQQQCQVTAVGDISSAKSFSQISAESQQHRTRAYLKIEDGCDQFCNYCIIPHVRGPVRSLPQDLALQQAQQLVQAGHREIVLSGIHIGAYGSDFGAEEHALSQLIEQISALPGLLRLRLGSIEPQQFSRSLKQVIAENEKVCPHLHIPLQAGADSTLAAMGRHYDTAFYADLLAELRSLRPGIAITSDVMTGYPGESEQDFRQSADFCAQCGFAGLHVFPYSRRKGTPAADYPHQVLQSVKAARAAELSRISKQSAAEYAAQFVGKQLCLLVEQQVEIAGQKYLCGHSENYLPLLLEDDGASSEIRQVKLQAISSIGLLCQAANAEKSG